MIFLYLTVGKNVEGQFYRAGDPSKKQHARSSSRSLINTDLMVLVSIPTLILNCRKKSPGKRNQTGHWSLLWRVGELLRKFPTHDPLGRRRSRLSLPFLFVCALPASHHHGEATSATLSCHSHQSHSEQQPPHESICCPGQGWPAFFQAAWWQWLLWDKKGHELLATTPRGEPNCQALLYTFLDVYPAEHDGTYSE